VAGHIFVKLARCGYTLRVSLRVTSQTSSIVIVINKC
jgi:hypothetical protein